MRGKSIRPTLLLALAGVLLAGTPACGGQTTITINAVHPGVRLSPLQYGLCFEEIHHAGDGGLYAEKLINRGFMDGLAGWSAAESGGATAVLNVEKSSEGNSPVPHTVRVSVIAPPGGRGGIRNEGYWGIGVAKGEACICTFKASDEHGADHALHVALVAPSGEELAAQDIGDLSAAMKPVQCVLIPRATEPKAALVFSLAVSGTFRLTATSLCPRNTFRQRPNGLRPDLALRVAAVRPSFVQFPGGSSVEGHRLADRFTWKTTLGDPARRLPELCPGGYQSSSGLGFHEYLQWCEDVNAAPLLVVNAGIAHTEVAPMEQMGPYLQDALDAIEYANGDVMTPWGAQRAAKGHPQPFHLNMLEIGDGSGGAAYEERYALFWDAIKQRYPNMVLIASMPVNSRPMDLVDERCQGSLEFLVRQARRYDSYPRTGPKVYIGAYAVTQGGGQGNLLAALGEAYFITGLERNADVVQMASHAPLLANVNDHRENQSALIFDTMQAFGTPCYWVQLLFSTNRGDVVLPSVVKRAAVAGMDEAAVRAGGASAVDLGVVATHEEKTGDILIKVVNITGDAQSTQIEIEGVPNLASSGTALTLTAPKPTEENSFDDPAHVAPTIGFLPGIHPHFPYLFPAYSVSILRLHIK